MDGGEVAIKTEGRNLKSPSKFECSALKKGKPDLRIIK
jgi:chaperone required for assembly of F1-ATPase